MIVIITIVFDVINIIFIISSSFIKDIHCG